MVEPEGRAAAPSARGTGAGSGSGSSSNPVAPSRQGKKAMTGYFSPEMSFAMHMTARKHGMSLQDAMAEAFNDWLRKMGESPVRSEEYTSELQSLMRISYADFCVKNTNTIQKRISHRTIRDKS